MRGVRGGPGLLALVSFFACSAPATVTVAAGTKLFTVTPCRVLDTRTGSPLLANSAQTFALTGTCGVPSSAVSVAANLTIVGPSAAGALVVYPTGSSIAGTSNLNFSVGATRANNAQIPLVRGAPRISSWPLPTEPPRTCWSMWSGTTGTATPTTSLGD